jgi:hypothetical protein
MPPGTPTGFPVAQVFSEEGSELDTPLAESFMADHDAALVQQFLHVSVTAKRPHGRCSGQEAQRKAVVEPNGVLDDGHREAGRRRVRRPFYPRHGGGKATPIRSRPMPVVGRGADGIKLQDGPRHRTVDHVPSTSLSTRLTPFASSFR